ncbi:MAG TPA: hypothetical protein VMU22_09520 [Rhizomicrobium sp.]|nr:hypothetical protein [Rhizomicrobium sp.]
MQHTRDFRISGCKPLISQERMFSFSDVAARKMRTKMTTCDGHCDDHRVPLEKKWPPGSRRFARRAMTNGKFLGMPGAI